MVSSQNGQSEFVEILLIMMSMNRTPNNMRKHTKQRIISLVSNLSSCYIALSIVSSMQR